MRILCITIILVSTLFKSHAQKVGAPCEGCEAIYEYGDKALNPIDTIQGFDKSDNKLLVTGTVFELDGKTPAKNVILYVYHTNAEGVYPTRGDEQGWARRHGYLRGWIKTDDDGKYAFYTSKPGTYPNRSEPAHIHITVKEPDKNEYWIDSFLFEGDPLLTRKERNSARGYGGTGIVRLQKTGALLMVKRDIILGKNIPNYH